MVLSKRSEYRAALEGFLRFHRSAYVELDEPALEAPLENLPHLYETWATLIIIDTLLELASELRYHVREQRLARYLDGGLYIKVLRNGSSAVVLEQPETGTVVRLTPQREFRPTGTHLRSISFTQIPDITIELRSDGEAPRLFLFDPKYKLDSEQNGEPGDGKPKKQDIDTMHAYRDAIRNDDEHRVVRYAAILYPGPEQRYGDGIEALSARPLLPDALGDRARTILSTALEV
jgi:predicted component of viral defense system (DUF524 family)